MKATVSFALIQSAHLRIADYIRHTPLERSRWLSGSCEAFLKLECFQTTGSFKLRGAMAKLTSIPADEAERGILTVSAGNHGIALAHAAELLGYRATVVVPETASKAKIEAIQRYPVDLIKRGHSYDEAERAGREMERDSGLVFVSPYNDPEVIAGQGTIAVEILADQPDIDAIIVPVGGGGLLAGILLAAKAIKPSIKVFGVEPSATPTMQRALDAGEIVEIVEEPTIADGLAGNIEPGSMTFPIIRDLVDRIILVDEPSIRRAIVEVALNDHTIIEGSAATAIAALTHDSLKGHKVASVISGRNISLDIFLDACSSLR